MTSPLPPTITAVGPMTMAAPTITAAGPMTMAAGPATVVGWAARSP